MVGELNMGTRSEAHDLTASSRISLCSLVRKFSAQLATNCMGGRRPKLKVPRVRRARVVMAMSISKLVAIVRAEGKRETGGQV